MIDLSKLKYYYKCIGDDALFLLSGKPKENLAICSNKNGDVLLYSETHKELGIMPKDFFEKNFIQQESYIKIDTKPTLENTLKLYETTYNVIKVLLNDFSKKQQSNSLNGEKTINKYITKIRKECRILDRIQPTIKHLKLKDLENDKI